jgi:predicted  nucleic acid-binding Zn-ribbon protein
VYVEFQLKREMHNIEQGFKELKERILSNKNEIRVNREKIEQNRNDITKLNNG